ncbi:MAG: hypothetical protein AB8C84_05410 [Oligoflexales bacterium]
MIDIQLASQLDHLYAKSIQDIQSELHELYQSQGPSGLLTLYDQSLQYQAHLIHSQKDIEKVLTIEKRLTLFAHYRF